MKWATIAYLLPCLQGKPSVKVVESRRCESGNGIFEFEGVPAGQYDLVFYQVIDDELHGRRITVRPGTTTVVKAVTEVDLLENAGEMEECYDRIVPEEMTRPDQFLAALKEQPFGADASKLGSGEECYRFLCIQSFSKHLFVRLVVHADRSGTLTWREIANDDAGWEPGGVARAQIKTIPAEKVEALLGLAEGNFWNLVPASECCHVGDGFTIIVDGRRGGSQKVVLRHTPHDAVAALARRFYEAAGKRGP